MSEAGSADQSPKAIIHKQILDAAEADPEASPERIADEISGASPDLVERVLDKYGDPADDDVGQPPSTDTSSPQPSAAETKYGSPGLAREEDRTAPQAIEHSNGDRTTVSADRSDTATPTQSSEDHEADASNSEVGEMSEPGQAGIEELSDSKREVLHAISERPEATQEELAEQFDVTAGTISRWVNDVPGFEWQRRESFVEQHMDAIGAVSDGGTTTGETPDREPTDGAEETETLEEDLDSIRDRISELEDHLSSAGADQSPAVDPELMAKVVRACVADDHITDEEEIDVISELLR